MYIVLSNSSDLPIYEQIKEQVKTQILSGELSENEMLPSLRQLAKDLKISVLTTTRAYNELEEEGFITSRQGKGFFVMPRGSDLLREQLIKDVETNLNNAILSAQRASMTDDELVQLLKLLLEVFFTFCNYASWWTTFSSSFCSVYCIYQSPCVFMHTEIP